ncbi:MAG: tRNA 2-selenouridine(34) synthase MnmH [Burkholderiaceae bacterium]|nr:tRNA 2-selenouridine(34) synthase MnmH [Burkholderiaceae bacterium]
MRDPLVIPVDEALAALDDFDDILDARSPLEFADDHLPGALGAPVLDDTQRALIGTIYRQQSPFEARRLGAALVSRNIAAMLEGLLADKPRQWRPLVYCWRGGNRSGALATVLARVGWRTTILEGGYRAFRRRVVEDLAQWPDGVQLRVLAGRTGTGKTLLLHRLAVEGAQVLDLEALAEHRGSVLGLMPQAVQASQRRFETRLWQTMRGFDPRRPVLVESESRRVGRCHLPDALIAAMRNAPCILVEASIPVRAALLLREYRPFTRDTATLYQRLDRLTGLHGHRQIEAWKAMAGAGDWNAFVASLLTLHYDPAYDRSTRRNYLRIDGAPCVGLESDDEAALSAAARQVIEAVNGSAPGPVAPAR